MTTTPADILALIRAQHRAIEADALLNVAAMPTRVDATTAFTSTAHHLFASFASEHAWRTIEYIEPPFEPTLDEIAGVPATIAFDDGGVCALTPPQIAIVCTLAYAPRRRVRLVSRRRHNPTPVTIMSRADDHRRIRLLLAPTGTGKTVMAIMSAMLAMMRTYPVYASAWRSSSTRALLPIMLIAAPRATMSSWMATTRACIAAFRDRARFEMLPVRVDDVKVTRTYIKRALASTGLFAIVQSSEVPIVVQRLVRAGFSPFGLIHDEMASERVQLTYTDYPFVLGITATPSSIPQALSCVRYDTLWRREIGSYVHCSYHPGATGLTDRSIADIATVASMDASAHYYPWLIHTAIERMPTGFHVFDIGIVDRSLTHVNGARETDPTNQISLANLCSWLQLSVSETDAPLPIVTLLTEFDAPETSERAHECMRRLRKRVSDGDIACVVCYESMVQSNELTSILITPCCTNLVCASCYARLQICPYCRRSLGCADTRIVNDLVGNVEAATASDAAPDPLPTDRASCAAMLRAMPPFENAFVACERILDMLYSVGMRRVILAWRFEASSRTLDRPNRRCAVLSPTTTCRQGRLLVAETIAGFNRRPDPTDPTMYVLVINSAVITKHTEVAGINLPVTDAIIFTGAAHDQVIGRILRMGEVGQAAKLVIRFTTNNN